MKLDGYVLGIDPSTACGFAVLRDDGSRVQSGVVRLHPRAHQGSGGRFCNLVDHLDSLIRTFPAIDSIAYEVPAMVGFHHDGEARQASAAQHLALFGIVAHVESWAERCGLHYVGFGPTEVKKIATGKGNAPKADVIAAMQQRFGDTVVDDNEADALAIALAGLVELGCVPPLVLTSEAPTKKRRGKTPDELLVDDFYAETET